MHSYICDARQPIIQLFYRLLRFPQMVLTMPLEISFFNVDNYFNNLNIK